MGSKGGGMTPTSASSGLQASTSTTTPNPEAMAAYRNVMGMASNVAQIPYQPYSGQMVAGFSPDQLAAFQGVRESQGIADPYIQGASSLVGQSLGFADPSRFNAQELSRYYNPYQQNVINATMANMKEMNASQQNQLTGDAIMKGYMGGDRAGIARAELARQQALTNNQTLAGLQQQGYQQAIDQYNKQQQTALGASQSGAYSLGQLGTQAQNAAMQGIQALLGTGGMQQQLGQQQLQNAYEQWQRAQGYPYQQAQWLAGITGATAPNMGGTTNSIGFGQQQQSQASPSPFSQAAGLGLSALSLLPKIFKDGGRVGYDDGGPVLDFVPQSGDVPNVWGPSDLDKIARSRWVSADPFEESVPAMRADGGGMPLDKKQLTSVESWIPAIELHAAKTDYPTPPKVDLPSGGGGSSPETGLGALSKGISGLSGKDVQGIKSGFGRLFGEGEPIQLPGAPAPSPVGSTVAPVNNELGEVYADGDRVAMADGGSPYAGWASRGAATGQAGSSLAPSIPSSAVYQPRQPLPSPIPTSSAESGFSPMMFMGGGGGGMGGGNATMAMLAVIQQQQQAARAAKQQAANAAQRETMLNAPRPPAGFTPSSLNYNQIDPLTGLYAARSWTPYYTPSYANGGAVRKGFFTGGAPDDDSDSTDMPDDVAKYLPALAKGESGGEKDPYTAVGVRSRRGDYPYGKYQVMGKNVPVWAKEAGLGDMTPQDFLRNPDAQEAVARHKFGQYLRETGSPQEAAAMWLGGPGYKSHPQARDALGTDVSKYVSTFNRNLSGDGSAFAYTDTTRPAGASRMIENTFPSQPKSLGQIADSGQTLTDASSPTKSEERTGLGSMWSPEVQQALLAAGLGMLASRSPFPGVAIGEGGLRGLAAYKSAQETAAETAQKQAEARRYEATLAETKRYHDLLTKNRESKTDTGHVGIIGEDEFGKKTYGYITGPKAGQPLETPAAATASSAGASGGIDWTKTGEEFLDQLPPSMQPLVKGYATGQMELPRGFGAAKTQPLYKAVMAYDPTFTIGNAASKLQMQKQFADTSPTKAGGQIIAANTAISHLGELSDEAEKLENTGFKPWNWLKQHALSATVGNPELEAFNVIKGRYVEEATKFYRGSGGTEADINRDLKTLSEANTPEELRTAIAKNAKLMQGKVTALKSRWANVMGEKLPPPTPDYEVVNSAAQSALERINQRAGAKGAAGAAAPAPAAKVWKEGDVRTGTRNGQPIKAVYRNGNWEVTE